MTEMEDRIAPMTEISKKEMRSVSSRAKEMLRPLVEIDDFDTLPNNMFHPAFDKCGSHEGVAILLVASEFPDREEELSKVEEGRKGKSDYEKATIDTYRLFENLMGLVSTALVVSSVSMTISVALLIVSVGSFDPSSPSLQGPKNETLGFYSSWASNGMLLHICHWLQQVFLALSIGCGGRSIMSGFFCYGAIGIYPVTLESTYELMFSDITHLGELWLYVAWSVLFFVLSLPFLTARISPVACLCSIIPIVTIFTGMVKVNGLANRHAISQWRTARNRLLK